MSDLTKRVDAFLEDSLTVRITALELERHALREALGVARFERDALRAENERLKDLYARWDEQAGAEESERDTLRARLEAAETLNLELQVQRNDELAECQTELELAEAVLKATAEHFAEAVAGFSAAIELGGERANTQDVLAITRAGKERLDAYFRKEKP